MKQVKNNMRKIILISIIVIVLVVAGFILFKKQPTPTTMPQNYNIVFKYGVEAKNELNTSNQTYTKDMIIDPPVTIKMKLSDEEFNAIYQKLNELDLFNESTKPEGDVIVTPCSSYYLKVSSTHTQKELSWSDCQGKVNDKFQEFSNYIIQIIVSKEEYKKLPAPRGGYI